MNQKKRDGIARRMITIAERHGGIGTLEGDMVEIHFTDVSVSFELDDLFKGGILAHWYNARRNLQHVVGGFDSVNTSHFRKATTYRDNAEQFAAALSVACRAIETGAAFQPVSE